LQLQIGGKMWYLAIFVVWCGFYETGSNNRLTAVVWLELLVLVLVAFLQIKVSLALTLLRCVKSRPQVWWS